jgi:hypothetical protein
MILTTLGTLMAEMFEMCLHTGKFWAAAKKCDDVWSAWAAGVPVAGGLGTILGQGRRGACGFVIRCAISSGRGGEAGWGKEGVLCFVCVI